MRRSVVVLATTLALVAPSAAYAAPALCDVTQLETLATQLPARPAAIPAGRVHELRIRITRGGQGAAGVDVAVALTGRAFDAWARALTAADGSALVRLKVPATARGAATLDVEAYRTVVDLPCLTFEEYDRNEWPWGSAR